MKLHHKVNLIAFGVLLASILATLIAGAVVIDDVVYRLNHRLLVDDVTTLIAELQERHRALVQQGLQHEEAHVRSAQKEAETAVASRLSGMNGEALLLSRSEADAPPAPAPDRDLPRLYTCLRNAREQLQGMRFRQQGVDRYGVVQLFAPWDWVVVSSVPETEMLRDRDTYLRGVLIAGAGILLAATLVASRFSRRLVRRIRDARDCVRAVGEGDLHARVPARGAGDEVTELKRGINAMADALEDRARRQEDAAEELARSRQRLQAILDHATIIVFVKDLAGRYTLVNRRFAGLFGLAEEDCVGLTDFALMAPDIARRMRARDNEVLHAGGAKTFEEPIAVEGEERIFMAVKFPLFDDRGEPYAVCGMATDITDRKRDELERERLLHILEAKNDELESIVYAASHDLRSPLVNIQGFAQELDLSLQTLRELQPHLQCSEQAAASLEQVLGEDLPLSLQYIRGGARRMDKLLNGLLRLSRLGRAPMDPKLMDPAPVVREVLRGMHYQIQEAKASVQVGQLPPCCADASLLAQLFGNLLDNAIKFLSPARPGEIRILGHTEAEKAVYKVADNGVGIPAGEQPHVFEIFRRGDPDAGPAGEGLGLTIVRRIVDRHGGRVWVESVEGEGTAFFLELPAVPPPGSTQF